jgi:hypothetical protein
MMCLIYLDEGRRRPFATRDQGLDTRNHDARRSIAFVLRIEDAHTLVSRGSKARHRLPHELAAMDQDQNAGAVAARLEVAQGAADDHVRFSECSRSDEEHTARPSEFPA